MGRQAWRQAGRRIPGAVDAPLPRTLSPELATLTKTVPAGDGWLNEIKYDGYRILARIENQPRQAVLVQRQGLDHQAAARRQRGRQAEGQDRLARWRSLRARRRRPEQLPGAAKRPSAVEARCLHLAVHVRCVGLQCIVAWLQSNPRNEAVKFAVADDHVLRFRSCSVRLVLMREQGMPLAISGR